MTGLLRRVLTDLALLYVIANVHHLAVALARWLPYRRTSWAVHRERAGTVRELFTVRLR